MNVMDLIAVLGFALGCPRIGYTIGADINSKQK